MTSLISLMVRRGEPGDLTCTGNPPERITVELKEGQGPRPQARKKSKPKELAAPSHKQTAVHDQLLRKQVI